MPWLRVQFMISLQMFQANVRQECMDAVSNSSESNQPHMSEAEQAILC